MPKDFPKPENQPIVETKDKEEKPINTETYVKNYFSDTPILAEIAKCESSYRHFDKEGHVLRGVKNDQDVGVMQINEAYHLDKAESLGYDIYTIDGNMAYAKYLYEEQGARPWLSSSGCWAHYKEIASK